MKKIIEIKRGYGVTELVLVDLTFGLILGTWVGLFIVLGIVQPAWWVWVLFAGYCGCTGYVCFVLDIIRERKRKQYENRKFQTYRIVKDKEDAA